MIELLQDETGAWSCARTSFWILLLFLLLVVTVDVFYSVRVSQVVYTTLGSILAGLVVWAAGPRIATYLGPWAQSVGAAIGQPKEPNSKTDDERGK